MTPHITVLIDTFNHERYIEEAIASVLEQDFPRKETEILVVDDGSTDRTPEIVRKFEPDVLLLQKPNGGQASAINFGTARSKGKLVAFLDGDDVWLPNKLSLVAKEFEREPRPVMAYHRYCFYNVAENWTWSPDYFAQVSGNILADRRKLLTYLAAPTSSLVFRRDILEHLMPVPEECSFMHDIYLIATAICLGPVAASGECLTKNRIHGQNLCFAERGQPNPKVLRQRLKAWKAAIASIREWARTNSSPIAQTKLELLIKRWELVQERDRFGIEPPGRLRYFAHLWRYTRTYAPVKSASNLVYSWAYAFAALVLGYKHVHYMEGVRTRITWLARHFERQPGQQAEGGPPE